ncbi:uncharacterized protein [Nicotiana sylvestris]|uniref:Auxin-responsive protein SAUR72-like n=2 Tax=Nicotiana TaxID=4085 RepID=A0A1S3XTP7_TOBAC|nr:PREDICTED: uncharacterized protein LOC104230227 [Nicotiana sylvestris]XP_016443259.1 PREDICTED: uncharacterized protein LOC107768649 [Nicotiana tabacum]
MDPSNKSVSAGSSSNKIRQIVRLQQLLKKWKKIAAASPSSTHLHNNLLSINNSTSSSTKSINKFLKKTLSFSEKDRSSPAEVCSINSSDVAVPKGCLAVSVGKEDKEEVKRFVIPMDYLGHPSFQVLLREAEEEFGFQQQGLLKIPCEVSVFEKILKNINSNNKIRQPPAPAHDHDAFFQLQQPHHSSDLSTINSVVVDDNNIIHNVGCCSPDNHQHHQGIMPPQLCS